MRTVSFSADPVQKLLKDDFVCATINIDGDPTAGASLAHAPTDSCGSSSRGIGRPNVQCLFLTPTGEIFHVASGYVGPRDMAKEIGFAKKTFDAIQKSPENAKKLVSTMHAARLKELGFGSSVAASRTSPSSILAGGNRFGGIDINAIRRARTPQQMRALLAQQQQQMVNQIADAQKRTQNLMQGSGGNDFNARKNSGIFSSFANRAVKGDHQFSIDKPLYSMSDFLDNPRVLIGNEKSAYGSVGPGGASGGTIGGNGSTRFISGQ